MKSVERRFEQEFSGEPANVLAAMDPGQVVRLSISVGKMYVAEHAGGFAMEIKFDRDDGCIVRALGPTGDWIVQVEGKLKHPISTRRPWYWWLRNEWLAGPLFAIPAVVALVAIRANAASGENVAPGEWASFVFLFSVLGATVGTIAVALLRKLLPAFELVAPGEKARGGRILGLLGAAILWLTGSVVLPLMLR